MIPQEVKDYVSAHRLGVVIEFVHNKKGYDVYSVLSYDPKDYPNGIVPPTGLPIVVLYKKGKDIICPLGEKVFDWL